MKGASVFWMELGEVRERSPSRLRSSWKKRNKVLSDTVEGLGQLLQVPKLHSDEQKPAVKRVALLVSVELVSLTGFDENDDNRYFVTWKRGPKKENQGETTKTVPVFGVLETNHIIQFSTFAKYNEATSSFLKKKDLVLSLMKALPNKKKVLVSTTSVTLSNFFSRRTYTDTEHIPVCFKTKENEELVLSIGVTVMVDCSREESLLERRKRKKRRISWRNGPDFSLLTQKQLEAQAEANTIVEEIGENEQNEKPFELHDFSQLIVSFDDFIEIHEFKLPSNDQRMLEVIQPCKPEEGEQLRTYAECKEQLDAKNQEVSSLETKVHDIESKLMQLYKQMLDRTEQQLREARDRNSALTNRLDILDSTLINKDNELALAQRKLDVALTDNTFAALCFMVLNICTDVKFLLFAFAILIFCFTRN